MPPNPASAHMNSPSVIQASMFIPAGLSGNDTTRTSETPAHSSREPAEDAVQSGQVDHL